MTKALSTLSVSEAASLAIEVLAYGHYLEDVKGGKYSWRDPYEGTFEQWLAENGEEYTEQDDPEEAIELGTTTFDNVRAWQYIKYEGGKGTRDNLTAERVAEYGGEGDGNKYWVVVSITDGLTTRYFRKDGYYQSYDGGYLDGDTSEVKPQEKVVIEYE